MRLIDADALKETIHINHYPLRGGINSIDNGMWTIGIDQAIDEQATIEAEPVRHGHWIFGESWMLGRNRRCSVCDSMFPCNDAWVMFYCPDCGAKMDEVSE